MFTLNLVTPEKRIVQDAEIDEVVVPAFRGQLDILPGHAPLMTTLGTGVLKYKLKGAANYETVVVGWGYAQVNPTGVVILAETAEMLEFIRHLKQQGLTIVLIEHKLSLVMELSDRVVVMDNGQKIAEGAPETVRNDPRVIEAYLGRKQHARDVVASQSQA